MATTLTDHEARILGCLMEKAMTTPDYYPLSLNALTNACNQKSNRDPVVDWDAHTVETAAAALVKKDWVHCSTVGRVPKYEETFTRQNAMVAAEAAVLCVLLLRGPQTPGTIRGRCSRMAVIEDLSALLTILERLVEWGYIRRLERVAGHKESRYMQLLCGELADDEPPEASIPGATIENESRLEALEIEVQQLKDRLDKLTAAFDDFRQQFD